ncbi:hypothetical protein RUM43_008627 [Polyplax serrata]|uniref:Uncharacterized protein n=1 Tax=Polyplax serrata TaxID=468196 RepID=A0AAN8PV91_POLSC
MYAGKKQKDEKSHLKENPKGFSVSEGSAYGNPSKGSFGSPRKGGPTHREAWEPLEFDFLHRCLERRDAF